MNASAPLKIISLGNCWENTHPDVIRVPPQFATYPYFMAFTPYPLMDDRLENPTIRASHNGLEWHSLSEMPDPIVSPPVDPGMHHADPELVYDSGRLHLIYLTIRRSTDEVTFNAMNCKNDFHWSNPEVIHRDVGAVSPTFQVSEGFWEEWFIRLRYSRNLAHSELLHCDGYDLTSLRNERVCDVEIPEHVPWHVDVLKVEEGYEALVAAFPKKYDPSRTRLFHLSSKDGLTFRLTKNPIIKPSLFGWDNRAIYRSSFLKEKDGSYRVWYSALSWGCHCGIGLLDGAIDSLNESSVSPDTRAPMPRYVSRLAGELNGWLRYMLRRHLPSRLISSTPTVFFMHRQR